MLERFTWYKQSAYRWRGDDLTVYVDPWGLTGDPEPADVILLTHAHYDHYSPDDLGRLRKDGTVMVAPHDVAADLAGNVEAVAPGDTVEAAGVKAHAVPAYNIAPDRLESHPKANGWVGYLIELDGRSHYFSGDTDDLPELRELRAQVAFVCVGGAPYTMGPAEAAGLVQAIGPELAVPNHYGYECGSESQGEDFRRAAGPIRVELMRPERPFEM